MISRQIEESTSHLFANWDAVCFLLGQDVKTSQLNNQWPFESLHQTSRRENFVFWWIAREDGHISLANDVSFIGTRADDYFPAERRRRLREGGFIDGAAPIGVIVRPLETPSGNLLLWLGFSTKSLGETRRRAVQNVTATAAVLLVILTVVVYASVRYFLRPIPVLTSALDRIGQGDLSSQVPVMSGDELGRVAQAFNQMATQLRVTTVSRDYIDKIVTSMIDPLMVVGADGLVQTANPATSELLGYPLSEVLGKPLAFFFPPGGGPSFKARIGQTPEPGAIRTEGQLLTKDGRLVPVLLAFSQMSQMPPQPPLIVCVVRDISERKEAERLREELIDKLQAALSQVKTLKGLIPICAGCKKIRDDQGYWDGLENYLRRHSAAEFTHGLCPSCIKKMYTDMEGQ